MSFPKPPFQITNPLIHEAKEYNTVTAKTFVSRCTFDANLYSEPLSCKLTCIFICEISLSFLILCVSLLLLVMNLMWDFDCVSVEDRNKFCHHYRIAYARMKQLLSSRNSQRKRVAGFLGIPEERLKMEAPPVHMPHAKLSILRMIQVWIFSETLVECSPAVKAAPPDGSFTIEMDKGNKFKLLDFHLEQVLIKERHKYTIASFNRCEQGGSFIVYDPFDFDEFINEFERKLLSYILEKDISLAWCSSDSEVVLYIRETCEDQVSFLKRFEHVANYQESYLLADPRKGDTKRGLFERRCGAWEVKLIKKAAARKRLNSSSEVFRRCHFTGATSRDNFFRSLGTDAAAAANFKASICWEFLSRKTGKKPKKKKNNDFNPSFTITQRGDCKEISKQDLTDLLGTSDFMCAIRGKTSSQAIIFHKAPSTPFPYNGKDKEKMMSLRVSETSSWNYPPFADAPEGFRLLSVLASGRRRGNHFISLSSPSEGADESETTIDFALKKAETSVSTRWKRFGTSSQVYVAENSVPASATSAGHPLFACCSNALEVNGGRMRVEGLTILPRDPLFLVLAAVSFGVESCVVPMGGDVDWKTKALVQWLSEQWAKFGVPMDKTVETGQNRPEVASDDEFNGGANTTLKARKKEAERKIKAAFGFNSSCIQMEEELICFPDRVKALCSLLEGIDGNGNAAWDSLIEKSLTHDNLRRWKLEYKTERSTGNTVPSNRLAPATSTHKASEEKKDSERHSSVPLKQSARGAQSNGKKASVKKNEPKIILARDDGVGIQNESQNNGKKTKKKNASEPTISAPADRVELPQEISATGDGTSGKTDSKFLQGRIVRTFSKKVVETTRLLFDPDQAKCDQSKSDNLVSSNILACLVQIYFASSREAELHVSEHDKLKSTVELNSSSWEILEFVYKNGNSRFQAKFVNDTIPMIPVTGRGKNNVPKWMKKNKRPICRVDALACIPPNVKSRKFKEMFETQTTDGKAILFPTIEMALCMETAFYLELQFASATKSSVLHWYDHPFPHLLSLLLNQFGST